MSTQPPPPTIPQLLTSLTTSTTYALPTPHPSFLQPILTTSRSLNLASLTATARHRILASDISLPLILDRGAAAAFPPNVTDRRGVERVLAQDVFCQVLDVEDVGRSRWEQIELLEAERKGEMVKGREVIRVVPTGENGEGMSSTATSSATSTQHQPSTTSIGAAKGPFLLQLQDHMGTKVSAFELQKIDKIGYPPYMGIGCKIWLKKGTKVARGMVLLEPERVIVVGGRVELWDTRWRKGREQRLREEVKRESEQDAGRGGGGGEG